NNQRTLFRAGCDHGIGHNSVDQQRIQGGLMIELEIQALSERREGLLMEVGRLVLASGFSLQRQRLVQDPHGILLTMVVRGPPRKKRALAAALDAHERIISFELEPVTEGEERAHFAASRAPSAYVPPVLPVAPPAPEAAPPTAPTRPRRSGWSRRRRHPRLRLRSPRGRRPSRISNSSCRPRRRLRWRLRPPWWRRRRSWSWSRSNPTRRPSTSCWRNWPPSTRKSCRGCSSWIARSPRRRANPRWRWRAGAPVHGSPSANRRRAGGSTWSRRSRNGACRHCARW